LRPGNSQRQQHAQAPAFSPPGTQQSEQLR
jgi:hypothetical protein